MCPTLASAILGVLHACAFTMQLCGEAMTLSAGEGYAERFIDLVSMWNGIGEEAMNSFTSGVHDARFPSVMIRVISIKKALGVHLRCWSNDAPHAW